MADVLRRLRDWGARLGWLRPAAAGSVDLQEVAYLQPLLAAVAGSQPIAVDVGANVGQVSRVLAEWGFTVFAVVPHPDTCRQLRHALRDLIRRGRVQVWEVAASDRDGQAPLFLASADTLSTLEVRWTEVAFPEYFSERRQVTVTTRRLAGLLAAARLDRIDFLKVDTEGHDLDVLRGLFDGAAAGRRPTVVMFEANQRFPGQAEACLALLAAQGYPVFDIFVKEGPFLLAAERFSGARLPAAWHDYGGRYFYANVIAYAPAAARHPALPVPASHPGAAAPAS